MNETRIIEEGEFAGDDKFSLIYQIVNSYDRLPSNFFFDDFFDGVQSAGLGSSASAAVSMIGAFNKWLGIRQSREEIAEKAWRMEKQLGWVSGKQDQYAAAFGGANYITFSKGKVNVHPIQDVDEFVDWCTLFYTGKTRHSATIQEKLKERIDSGKATEALRDLVFLARNGMAYLKGAQYLMLGKLLNTAWKLKKKSNPACTNRRVNYLYKKGLDNGALGGKILGAGSDGHILFVTHPKNKQNLIKKMRLEYVDFSIDKTGLEVKLIQ